MVKSRIPQIMMFSVMLTAGFGGVWPPAAPAQQTAAPQQPLSEAEKAALLARVIANEEKNELEQDYFERIERKEILDTSGTPSAAKITTVRAIPAGTGVARLRVKEDGAPADAAAFREELRKLCKTLEWAAGDGPEQRAAYAKVKRKHNDRIALIEAAGKAFRYTLDSRERRDGHLIAKIRFEPDPSFKPTSRATSFFPKVSGYMWIDENSSQLVRIEGALREDISFGLFLVKIYKGTRFMQERAEVEPGVWLPTLTEYEYAGRKFFSQFAVKERTQVSHYRRIGPPAKALKIIRAEIGDGVAGASEVLTP